MLCAASALAQQNDWLIVPGKRLGPITLDTTRTDLEGLFGKTNVLDQPVETGEGPEPGTVVFPGMPTGALAILWQRTLQGNLSYENHNRISDVRICYQPLAAPCKWHTENGVSLGTNLKRLETLNGRAFQIEPWGYDLGGNISSWRGGRLAGVFEDGGKSWWGADSKLWLTVGWQQSPNGYSPQQRKSLDEIGRQERNPLSTDSAVRLLHPTVIRMWLIFPSNGKASSGK